MLVDVITRAPKVLTYSVPPPLSQKIKVGQIVLVPLGNKNANGMILNLSVKKKYPNIKPIKQILIETPILFDYQIKLARWIADYYCSSLYKAVNLMLPPSLSSIKDIAFIKSRSSLAQKPVLFWTHESKQKEKFYFQKIKKCLLSNKQAVLVYPKIPLNQSLIDYLLSNNPQKMVLLADQTNKEFSSEWQAIRKNVRQVVIGSQKPLFMPYSNLGLIIVDEEQDDMYKQERAPRYHASQVALKLAEYSGAELILSTSLPGISSYYKVQKKYYNLLNADRETKTKEPKKELVDLSKIPYSERIISPQLKKDLNENLAQKKQSILFLNRKGTARAISCPDCGATINCSSCGLPMVYYDAKTPYLWCSRCNKKRPVPENCPKCLSLFIAERGLGIGTIKKELTKFYPLANIKLLDKEIASSNLNKIITEWLSKKIDILIATQIVLNYPEFKAPQVVIISADSELAFPDFESERKTFSTIFSLIKKATSKIIIQTYNPDLPSIKNALVSDFDSFYKAEIEKRKLFSHPPFVQIIKLVFRHKNSQEAQRETEKFFNQIANLKEKDNAINIIGPSPCFIPKIRGLYRWQIIIKLNKENDRLSAKQNEFKSKLNELISVGWTIDVDPTTII